MDPLPYTFSTQLLLHHSEMLRFLYYTPYDIIYESFELKHAAYSYHSRDRPVQRYKAEEIARHFSMASEKLHIRLLREDIALDKQLTKLEAGWHMKCIPYFHRYYFEKYLFTAYTQTIAASMTRQERILQDESHTYFAAVAAINARESCLRNLKRSLAELDVSDVHEYLHVANHRLAESRKKGERQKFRLQGYRLQEQNASEQARLGKTRLEGFIDGVEHMSRLTIYCIELVQKWKEYIYGLTHDARKQRERVEYYFYDENYFLKILSDLGFVKVSVLSTFFEFAPRNDPFLLHPQLALERSQNKTTDAALLHALLLPKKENLTQIISKMELLSEEYRANIKSRKNYSLQAVKPIRNEPPSPDHPVSNAVPPKLKDFQPQRSQSLKTFRVKQHLKSSQTPQIVVQFDRKKRATSIPAVGVQNVTDRDTSPLKNSIILQKHEHMAQSPLGDEGMLSFLKAQVIKRVRQDFTSGQVSQLEKIQALELLIEGKVNQAMQQIFPFQPEKNKQLPLVTALMRVNEMEIGNQVAKMFAKALPRFEFMQPSEASLIKAIGQCEYIYMLRVTIGEEELGRMLLTPSQGKVKTLRALYVFFPDVSEMERLIRECLRFVWEHQNSLEVHLNFNQPSNNQIIDEFLDNLEKIFTSQGVIARRQLYSSMVQVKFAFTRKAPNPNYMPTTAGLCFSTSALLADHKLLLQNQSRDKKLLASHDFLLMLLLKKCVSGSDLLFLKEKISWKERLRLLLEDMQKYDQRADRFGFVREMSVMNVSDLNTLLTKQNEKLLQVSDIIKANSLNMLRMELKLQMDFPVHSLFEANAEPYHRYTINGSLQVIRTEDGSIFYLLPALAATQPQIKIPLKIAIFEARNFIRNSKENTNLYIYLNKALREAQASVSLHHLWVPMCRFPEKYHQRSEVYVATTRCQDLFAIGREVLFGETMEWSTNMPLQNSIILEKEIGDIILEKPLGVSVMTADMVIYSRIFL